MKKLLASLFILGFFFAGANHVHASILSEVLSQIQSLENEVSRLKSELKATSPYSSYWTRVVNNETKNFNPGGSLPIVANPIVTSVTHSSAILSANITSLGNPVYTVYGVCYSPISSIIPSITNGATCIGIPTTTTSLSATGPFMVPIISLVSNTKYNYRAYVANTNGISYSPLIEFTTLDLVTKYMCSDSDGGIAPFTKGAICRGSYCEVDSCRNANSLDEKSCDGAYLKSQNVICNCNNGACTRNIMSSLSQI